MSSEPAQDWFRVVFVVGSVLTIHLVIGSSLREQLLAAGIALIVVAFHKPNRHP